MGQLDGSCETLITLGVVILQANLQFYGLKKLPLLLLATIKDLLEPFLQIVNVELGHLGTVSSSQQQLDLGTLCTEQNLFLTVIQTDFSQNGLSQNGYGGATHEFQDPGRTSLRAIGPGRRPCALKGPVG